MEYKMAFTMPSDDDTSLLTDCGNNKSGTGENAEYHV